MMMAEQVCQTDNICIRHGSWDVPGLYCVEHKNESTQAIEELSSWIWIIRRKLEEYFNCIVGIYMELDTNARLHTIILPFHIHALRAMDIPFEPYQPHIQRYLLDYRSTQQEHLAFKLLDGQLKSIAELGEVLSLSATDSFSSISPLNFRERPSDEILYPVAEIADLGSEPEPPVGMKCFSCIGGNRNFQCFFAEQTLSRAGFMRKYQKSIERFLHPVFCGEDLEFHQDAKYPIPGFFIVAPTKEYRNVASMPLSLFQKCMKLAFELRTKLLHYPDVRNVYIYYDEHVKKPSSVHIWVLPVYDAHVTECTNPSMLDHSVWNYMNTFVYNEEAYRITKILGDLKRIFINEL